MEGGWRKQQCRLGAEEVEAEEAEAAEEEGEGAWVEDVEEIDAADRDDCRQKRVDGQVSHV